MAELSAGMQYLKLCKIIHGDIKGVSTLGNLRVVRTNLQTQTNILIDDSGRVRISDYGLAVYDSDTESSSGHFNGGTIRWMSPERLNPETRSVKATFSSDVYSFAMVIYEVSEQFFLP